MTTPPTTAPRSNIVTSESFFARQRPGPAPPSCFSELAGLAQCYNDVMMMQQIFKRVICDLSANDTEFQKCIAEAVAAQGAGMPIAGVTDGSAAQPGIVGEFIQYNITAGFPSGDNQQQMVTCGVVQPGDWDCYASAYLGAAAANAVTSVTLGLPETTGFSNNMWGQYSGAAADTALSIPTPMARLSSAVPTLVTFAVTTYAAAGGELILFFMARRAR